MQLSLGCEDPPHPPQPADAEPVDGNDGIAHVYVKVNVGTTNRKLAFVAISVTLILQLLYVPVANGLKTIV